MAPVPPAPDPAPKGPLVVGWREWVRFPALGLPPIKAKIDTGARTSALHAFDIQRFRRRKVEMVRFRVHPIQRNTTLTCEAEAEYLGERQVRSSSGHLLRRPVVRTEIELLGRRWPIEVTLASRDSMGFRMLLGRRALKGVFLVDPSHSFRGGRPPAKKKKKKKG